MAAEAGDAVTEEGKPETVTVTVELKPSKELTDTVREAGVPGDRVNELGETEIEKSPVCGVGVEVTTAVDVLAPLEPSPQLTTNPRDTNKTRKQAREAPMRIKTR